MLLVERAVPQEVALAGAYKEVVNSVQIVQKHEGTRERRNGAKKLSGSGLPIPASISSVETTQL